MRRSMGFCSLRWQPPHMDLVARDHSPHKVDRGTAEAFRGQPNTGTSALGSGRIKSEDSVSS